MTRQLIVHSNTDSSAAAVKIFSVLTKYEAKIEQAVMKNSENKTIYFFDLEQPLNLKAIGKLKKIVEVSSVLA